jgi:predicted P-loop ATPase
MTDTMRAPAAATAQGPRVSVQQDSSNSPEHKATNGNAQARRKTDDWEPRFKVWLRRQSDERVRQIVRAATAEDEQRRRTSAIFQAERSRHYRPRGLTVGDRVEVMRRIARWP